MFDISKVNQISSFDINDFKGNSFIWVFNADKRPPHIGFSSDLSFYSLKVNSIDDDISLSRVFDLITKKEIPTLVFGIKQFVSVEELNSEYKKYADGINEGESCLFPINHLLMKREDGLLHDLITSLDIDNEIKNIFGRFLPSDFQWIPLYDQKIVQCKIKELRNA